MQVYSKKIKVSKNDLDQLNHVNNVRYVQWVQDIAEAHWLTNAPKEVLDSYFWVLLKHTINYLGEALVNDVLTLKTHVSKSDGVTSIRHVEAFNETSQKLIMTSETKWCLMSYETKRPARITSEIKNLFN